MKSSFWTWHVALEEVSRDILALEWRNSQSPRTLPHGIAPQERFRGVPLKKFAQNPKCPSVPQDLQECPVLKSILQSHKSAGCLTRVSHKNVPQEPELPTKGVSHRGKIECTRLPRDLGQLRSRHASLHIAFSGSDCRSQQAGSHLFVCVSDGSGCSRCFRSVRFLRPSC